MIKYGEDGCFDKNGILAIISVSSIMCNDLEQTGDVANVVDIIDVDDVGNDEAVGLEALIQRNIQSFFINNKLDYIHHSDATAFGENLEIDLDLVHLHNLRGDLYMDADDTVI